MKTNLQGEEDWCIITRHTSGAVLTALLSSLSVNPFTRIFLILISLNCGLFNSRDLAPATEMRVTVAPTRDPHQPHFVSLCVFALTSMTGVSRVVAVVAGDPQDPVLDVVHPVGCHFGAAVHEDAAAAAAVTGRRRLARQVCVLQGLQPDARLLSTLQNTLGAHHVRSERAEMRRERERALISTTRETLGAASTISRQQADIQTLIHIPSVMLPDAEQGYQTPETWQT